MIKGNFQQILREQDAIAVALSGGCDSMALLHDISTFLNQESVDCQVHALIIDHGLRAESADEAAAVRDVVARWPCVQAHILNRPAGFAEEARIQENARHDRYALLFQYCHDNMITHLFVGHHQDDQLETFLFRLAKGSGLDGLACMEEQSVRDHGILLCRPFLDVPKDKLIRYCDDYKIHYVRDPSNADPKYARPRLRAVRDALEEEGLTGKRIAVTARRMRDAKEALDTCTNTLFDQAVIENHDDGGHGRGVAFDYQIMCGYPFEIQKRILMKAMDINAGDQASVYGPRMERVEDLVRRIFEDGDFPGATLGGSKFSVDTKKQYLSIEPQL